jgi:hypothetical protein
MNDLFCSAIMVRHLKWKQHAASITDIELQAIQLEGRHSVAARLPLKTTIGAATECPPTIRGKDSILPTRLRHRHRETYSSS